MQLNAGSLVAPILHSFGPLPSLGWPSWLLSFILPCIGSFVGCRFLLLILAPALVLAMMPIRYWLRGMNGTVDDNEENPPLHWCSAGTD